MEHWNIGMVGKKILKHIIPLFQHSNLFALRPLRLFFLGLLPIEWVISVDFPSPGMLLAKVRGIGEGPRERIPSLAGHHKAVALSSVRVGSLFCWPDRSRDSVFRKEIGDRSLAEPKQPPLNPGCSRRCCPAMYGMRPLGGECFVTFSTHSTGR